MKRRILSIITALALCLSLCPTWAFAAEGEPDTGLCDHHPEHIGCGYAAPTEGQPCGHVHTDECYAEETLCVHVHDESCYSDGLLPAEDEDRAAAACAHTCSVESGCVTRTLNCQHSHDSECGYVQSDPGTPCGYVCNLCPIEDLIAALPEQVTEDNAADVRAQLDEILALFGELTGEEQEQINLSHIYTLQGALDEANAPTAAEGAPTEQFPALTPGGTYWFDLSGAGIPGQVNTGNSDGAVSVPDTTLHWVPFTYAGTINAYVLNKSSSGQTGASNSASGTTDPSGQYGYTYDHSLFIADYNVTYTVSWNDLNGESMIFGTAYTSNGVGYTLRAPSVGNNYDSNGGVPKNNEWDGILDKNDGDIKNWSKIYSWGQDGLPLGSSYRAVRGYVSARDWNGSLVTDRSKNFGFRPVLELPAPDTLASDSLKVVTLNLNGGKIGSETGSVSIVVKSGGSFTAPGSEGLTRPDGSTGDFFCWLGSDGKAYRAKESVPANVTSLTAQWEKITPTVTPPTAISSLTYTGEAQALISAGSTSGGELQYSTDNSTWSASIPTGTEVNTYTVYYKVVGDDIYTDVAAQEISVSIGKASTSVTAAPTATGITYGEALSDSTLTGGAGSVAGAFSWTDGTVKPSAGTAQFEVTFTPTDTTNYNTATVNVSVTVDKATPTVTWTNATQTLDYTGSAAAITTPTVTLVNNEPFTGTINYSYTGTTSGTGLPTNAGTYTIKAHVDAAGNYTAADSTNELTLTIKKDTNATPPGDKEGYELDYAQETITVKAGYEVNTAQDGSGAAVPSGSITGYLGQSLYIRKVEDDNHAASGWTAFTLAARPAAPSLTKTDETLKGKVDGGISGADSAMEYSTDGGTTWKDYVDGAFTGLAGGTTVQVRVKAAEAAPHGEVSSYNIAVGEPITVKFAYMDGAQETVISTLPGLSYENTVTKPEKDPERTDYKFLGWYKTADGTTEWNFATDKVTVKEVTIYAKWQQVNFKVGGTVKDSTGTTAINGATVTLKQGSRQIDQGITGSDGAFTFSQHIPAGAYNIVTTSGNQTKTTLITIESSDMLNVSVTLPPEGV